MSGRAFYMPKTGPDGESPVVVVIGPASFPGDPLLGSASSYKEVETRLHAVTCGAVVSRADCWMCAPTAGHKIFFRAVERQADLKFLWKHAPELFA